MKVSIFFSLLKINGFHRIIIFIYYKIYKHFEPRKHIKIPSTVQLIH